MVTFDPQRNFATAEERLCAFGGGNEQAQVWRRLARALAELRGVQRGAACLLELAGAEPDAVRAQLRHCLVSLHCISHASTLTLRYTSIAWCRMSH